MEDFILGISIVMALLAMVVLYRVVYGPTVLDRIVAVGVIGTKTTMILCLMGLIYKRIDMFVDIALAYALLNFIATLAAGKFFRVRKSIMPGEKYFKDREMGR
jgi:multicomponent Na+:H+ antiporter subunit F